jgi:hypothetical protein
MYQRLLLQHRLLRPPNLVHNRLHFCHIPLTKRSDLVPKSIYAFDIPNEIARVKRYKEYAEYCLKQLEQMQKEG